MKEKEFLEMLRTHRGILVKVCTMYCTDAESRRDLYQEIVLQLWKAASKFRAESKVSTWIYQIAVNTAITDFRRNRQKATLTSWAEEFNNLPDDETNREQPLTEWLQKAISTLSDTEKALLMLYFDNKTSEEIAEILGITSVNVRVKMHRIQEKLRKLKPTAPWK